MQRKNLSADGMIKIISNAFSKIPDPRTFSNERTSYSLKDAFLTAYAAFSLKYESLNLFFSELEESEHKKISAMNLYKMNGIPSTKRLKEIIDPIPSDNLRPVYKDIFRELQRGKALENFLFLDKFYIFALDGTGYYSSEKVHCKKCLVKKHKSGKVTYSHQMLAGCFVHPLMKQVIPVAPEPIQNSDGNTKNDCERNAAKRFLKKIREDHPKLSIIVTEDGLASNAPHIKELWNNNMHFILGVKPGDHKYLFDWINSFDDLESTVSCKFTGKKVVRKITQKISFVNEVPLNDSNHDIKVNFMKLTEYTERKLEDGSWISEGNSTTFTWITDLKITKENAHDFMLAGRKRWSIENETFNTLKNQGYNFEHSFGHGRDHLATNFAFLMMLAFFVDQVQEMCCKIFQKVAAKFKTKKNLWNKIRACFEWLTIQSGWTSIWDIIIHPEKQPRINTC